MVGHLVLAPILLKPFENWTKSPVFEWSAIFLPFESRTEVFLTSSLDRFKAIKNIFL
jgi:hypothetical protein